MSGAKDVKFSLRVMINKQKTKVLFAEADGDFADVLISFLTLPLGTIVKVLKKHYGDEAPVFGSLTTLYNGLANLDISHFWKEGCKEMLLNPRSSFEAEWRKLKLDINDTNHSDCFPCPNPRCSGLSATLFNTIPCIYGIEKCVCGVEIRREECMKDSEAAYDNGGVFTFKTTSFIITDDLQIYANTIGFIQTLRNFGITDVHEPMDVTFGFSEIMDLLKGSLLSPAPLTSIILNINSAAPKSEPAILSPEMEKEASSNTKKMTLKVILQKSTNRVLFAESDECFIEFLYSMLIIPLGAVESLLGSNTCLKSIDNLYRSLDNLNEHSYLVTGYTKERLMGTVPFSSIEFLKGRINFFRGTKKYNITDDLTVTPFCITSNFSVLKGLKIPLSDVKELELEIGSEQALSILKASLTSTSALTDGLKIKSILMKQPKQEI